MVAAVATVGVAALPASGARSSARADELRRANDALAARSRSAVLELYALQSQAAAARAAVADVQARVDAVTRERATVANRLQLARSSLAAAQAGLAERLRALYEQGGTDPLSIILSAESIEDALTTLDGIGFAAQQDRTLIARTRAARVQLARLANRLDARAAELASLEREAAARVGALEAKEAERTAFLATLAREQRLNATQIAALSRRATAAQSRSSHVAAGPASGGTQILDAEPVAGAPAAAASPAPGGAAPAATAGRTLVVSATAYALRGRTASGLPTAAGVAAVDPSVIPLGTRFFVPGYGEAIAADVGPAVRGNAIDLWFPSHGQARAWGRRTVTIVLH